MMKLTSVSAAIISALAVVGIMGDRSVQAQDPMLTDTVWALQQIQYNNDTMLVPDNPENYTIQFLENGNVSIQADCNAITGTYDPESNEFITLGASTLAACPPDSIDDEYRMGLENAALYFFEDGNLYMDLFADAGTMMFAPVTTGQVGTETTETTETSTESEPVRGLW